MSRKFRTNLTDVGRRILSGEGAILVFQTYYGCDLERMDPKHAETFVRYMDVVRETARDLDSVLIDHLARWDRLRVADVEAYRALMNDPMHVNPVGNMTMGLDLLKAFGADVSEEARPLVEEGRRVQQVLDSLEQSAGR